LGHLITSRQVNNILYAEFIYQKATDIKQSFCNDGEFNRTFSVDQSQIIQIKNFLCNNLSAIDLKLFLINVQKQLDAILLVKRITSVDLLLFNFLFRLRKHSVSLTISLMDYR